MGSLGAGAKSVAGQPGTITKSMEGRIWKILAALQW